MGDDYDKKLEKKRKKAEYKLEKERLKKEYDREKKRLEAEAEAASEQSQIEGGAEVRKEVEPSPERRTPSPDKSDEKTIQIMLPEKEPKPWYKNPDWIRAIAAIVVMIIVILTFYFTFYQ